MSYIQPSSSAALPGSLTLPQFIQSVIVGVLDFDGTLVRPNWQQQPPKQPDINVDWIAFGINSVTPDANAFYDADEDGVFNTQRHETLEVQCSFYGPAAMDNAALLRDGLNLPQNLEALRAANMGFINTSPAISIPDLVNERWINRFSMSLFFRREIQRVYPVPTLLAINGKIHMETAGEEETESEFIYPELED